MSRLRDELAGLPWAPAWFRRWAAAWLGYTVVHDALLPGGGSLRVLERGGMRHLRFGDAWEDQSAVDLEAPLRLVLPYTRVAALALALPPRLDDVLHVGLGGGTLARAVHAVAPGARQDAVEPFAEVVETARRYFALPAGVRVAVAPGDVALPGLSGPYDLVVLDAFTPEGRQVGPPDLARLRRLLRKDGWLLVNATHDVRATIVALLRVFASVAWHKLPDTDQYVLLASDSAGLVGVRARARRVSEALDISAEPLLDGLVWAEGSILAGPPG